MYYSTSIAVVAGLCLAFGLLYLFVAIRQESRRTENLLFAVFALAYAGASITAQAGFTAATPEDWLLPIRISFVFAPIALSAFVWYIAAATDVRPRVVLWVLSAVYVLIGVVAIVAPRALFAEGSGVETIELPWGEVVRIFGSEPGGLLVLVSLAQLVTLVFVGVAITRQYRRGDRREAKILSFGVVWFIAAMALEILSATGMVRLVPTADFGFLGFVVAIVVSRVDAAIETDRQLREYRDDLEERVADRTAQLQDAQAQLLVQAEQEAALAERSRLARELHDVVSQLLFSINLLASSLPRLWEKDPAAARRTTVELQRLTKGALAEMRILLRELRPHTIVATDLGTLITQLSDGLAARHEIPVDLAIDVDGDLPDDVHVAVYRIAQEAMTNVAKHAEAGHLTVTLAGGADHLVMVVRDDGVGIGSENGRAPGMGISIMEERADAIGASISVDSVDPSGTEVLLTWGAVRDE